MNKTKVGVFTLLSIIIIGISVFYFSNYVFPWEKKNAIETTLDWAGISQLPVNNEVISIEKRGTLFSRQFILKFEASDKKIEDWIEKETVFKNINPIQKNNSKKYNIKGRNGSIGGKIIIHDNKVLINMSWS